MDGHYSVRIEDLLVRIDYAGSLAPDENTLASLQDCFNYSIPFENLDIHMGVRLVLDLDAIWDKIVHRQRGGWCYELNETFLYLLQSLGYSAFRAPAEVLGSDHGDPYSHQVSIVTLSENWFVDVGFGTTFSSPLLLNTENPQSCRSGVFRVLHRQGVYLIEREEEGGWHPLLRFAAAECRRMQFESRCNWLQTSPESHFTRKRLCSKLTPKGRWTLSGNRLLFDGEERELVPESDYLDVLEETFGISLATPAWVDPIADFR
jgi:N-hydroxyarylamine O-acetyltransferase